MAKTKPKDDPLSPGHHCYGHYGYEVLPDGRIRLPSGLYDPMKDTLHEERGLREMLNGVSAFVAQRLSKTSRKQAEWWKQVGEELSVEITSGSGWTCDGDGILTPPKENKDAEKAHE